MERSDVTLAPPVPQSVARFESAVRGMRSSGFWLGALGLLTFALAWEIVADLQIFNSLFFAPIRSIVAEAWAMYTSGSIYPHLGYTLQNFAIGFLIGTLTGIPLGMLLGWYRRALQFADPILSIGLATPVIALVPLVIAIFGIYWQSKVAITTWAVFFPVLVSMIAGVQGADGSLVKVARSFQAGDLKILRDVVLPGAVPSLVSGLRLGLSRGLIGELAAEFFGAPQGLGFLAFNYSTTFQPAKMFVAILTMALLGVLFTELIKLVQDHFDAWRPERV